MKELAKTTTIANGNVLSIGDMIEAIHELTGKLGKPPEPLRLTSTQWEALRREATESGLLVQPNTLSTPDSFYGLKIEIQR